jgi:NADH dehydrogenase
MALNLGACIREGAEKPFIFSVLGLAAIGKRTGVANILGLSFSVFIAWFLWRTIYLSKLPRLEKKIRVVLNWTLDMFFSKDLVEFSAVRATAAAPQHGATSVPDATKFQSNDTWAVASNSPSIFPDNL